MPQPRQSPLRFDKRRGGWVEQPKSFLQELNEKTDDFHAGLIMGTGVGGLIACVVMFLAALTNLL